LQRLKHDEVRAEIREIHMAADDEDLPARYLLYVVGVIVAIVVAAVGSFLIFVR
jgi:hypothetical protein